MFCAVCVSFPFSSHVNNCRREQKVPCQVYQHVFLYPLFSSHVIKQRWSHEHLSCLNWIDSVVSSFKLGPLFPSLKLNTTYNWLLILNVFPTNLKTICIAHTKSQNTWYIMTPTATMTTQVVTALDMSDQLFSDCPWEKLLNQSVPSKPVTCQTADNKHTLIVFNARIPTF